MSKPKNWKQYQDWWPGWTCERGGCGADAVGCAYVPTPIDGSVISVGPDGIKVVREPDGKEPSYYLLAMCPNCIKEFFANEPVQVRIHESAYPVSEPLNPDDPFPF